MDNITLSYILHQAVDTALCGDSGNSPHRNERNQCIYSCNAIDSVCVDLFGVNDSIKYSDRIRAGLLEMGLPLHAHSFANCASLHANVWGVQGNPEKWKQQARALWLTWAALMAEEQGV